MHTELLTGYILSHTELLTGYTLSHTELLTGYTLSLDFSLQINASVCG